MVTIPRLLAPYSLAMDQLLPANKANTRSARNGRFNFCGDGSRPYCEAGARHDDSRDAGESDFWSVVRRNGGELQATNTADFTLLRC